MTVAEMIRNAASDCRPAASDMHGNACGCGWTWVRCFFCGEMTFDATMAPKSGGKMRDACLRCADAIKRGAT
jgi:hypothetical protein